MPRPYGNEVLPPCGGGFRWGVAFGGAQPNNARTMPTKRLLIVAHAPSPNTRRLVEAVLKGARSPDISGVDAVHKPPLEAGPDDVLAAHAVILGTTENLGYMSGALKDFFDRSYYPILEKTQGMPYCLYIRAGHDGTGTRRGVETIVTGLALARGAGAADPARRLAGGLRRPLRGARHGDGGRARSGRVLTRPPYSFAYFRYCPTQSQSTSST